MRLTAASNSSHLGNDLDAVESNSWKTTRPSGRTYWHKRRNSTAGSAKYAVQITVADVRDGACSSSTLKEASSWGKVSTVHEQMVYAEATTVLPFIIANAYQTGAWKKRKPKNYTRMFEKA